MRVIIGIALVFWSATFSLAQFSVGTSGFSIKGGTSAVLNQLVLIPDDDFTILETNLAISSTPITGIPSSSISKVYTASPSFANYKGTVGFYFLNSELNGNLIGDLTLVYNQNSDGGGSYVTTSSGVVTGNYVSHYFSTAMNLGKITATSEASALPVRLIRFEVRKAGAKAKIEWTTALELNNSHFIVERSVDARTFTTLTQVSAIENAGSKNDYVAFDELPEKSTTYYRLKQVDLDGSVASFGIRAYQQMSNLDELKAFAYPMPAQERLHIKLANPPGQQFTVNVVDLQGRSVFRKVLVSKEGGLEIRLPEQLSSGNYVLNLKGEGMDQSIKIVVNR